MRKGAEEQVSSVVLALLAMKAVRRRGPWACDVRERHGGMAPVQQGERRETTANFRKPPGKLVAITDRSLPSFLLKPFNTAALWRFKRGTYTFPKIMQIFG